MFFRSELTIESFNEISMDDFKELIAPHTNILLVFANTYLLDIKPNYYYYHRDEFDESRGIDVPAVSFELSRNLKQQSLIDRYSAFLVAYTALIKSVKLPLSVRLEFST